MGMRSSVARTKAKSSELYTNADWDMVDSLAGAAPAKREAMIEKFAESELPPAVSGMSSKEIGKVVAKKSEERKKIQKEIAELTAKRDAFLAKKSSEQGQKKATLNDAVLKSLRKAAAEKGFKNP